MADAGGARFIKDEQKIVMPKKLKESEVSMLVILAIIAVAALGVYFVLFPMFTNMRELTGEIDELQAKQYEYRNQIAQTEMFQQQYKEAQADFYRYFNYFYSPMDPEIVDERITSMLIVHEMTPATLSMTTLEVEGVPPYLAQELRANPLPESIEPQQEEAPATPPPAEDMPADDPTAQAEPEPVPEEEAIVDAYAFVYTVNVSAYGTRDMLYTFLAQAATMTAFYVESFDFTDPVTTKDTDGRDIVTPGQINMQIKMYVLIDGVPARDFGAGGQ